MAHHYTWDKLVKNSARLNPKVRGVNYPYTPNFETLMIIPYIGTKSCLVKLQAWGVTQSRNLHQVTLLFNDCEILTGEQEVSLWQYFKVEYQGQTYYVKKFDKLRNPLTHRCTCFTGDTKVLLADGSYKTFKELEGQTNFDIISYNDKSDTFEIVTAHNCEKKKENAEIIRVTLDNGRSVDCTPDHRFLTKEGDWVQAQNLQEGQSLRALYMDKHSLKRLLSNGYKESIHKHKAKTNFYVYVYLDPRYPGEYNYESCSFNFKPIYIGKGVDGRCYSHLNTNSNDRFHNTVRKLMNINMPPIILKYSVNLEESVAYKIERRLTEEIGLNIENKGPLLNCRHGGYDGNSSVSALKLKIKNIESGFFEKLSKRMKENNPMKNPEVAKRMSDTYRFKHTEKQRKDIAYKACHSLDYESRKKLGQNVGNLAKEAVAKGEHHTLTEQWKNLCRDNMLKRLQDPEKCRYFKQCVSNTSKKNWQDEATREKMFASMAKRRQQFSQYLYDNTVHDLVETVKKYGQIDLSKYNYKKGYNYSPNMIKSNGKIKKEVNEKALGNHKVIKIEKVNNQDVYCLTAEYLGNFVVETCDNDSNIFSGVVVENCADFFYSWAWGNYYNGKCLYGPPPKPYRRKTNWMPPRNPGSIIGVCKHIYNAWDYLKRQGLTLN